jgi:hypothetical protein
MRWKDISKMRKRMDIKNIFLLFGMIATQAACAAEPAAKDDGLIFDVPRLETTTGPSMLDNPTADRGGELIGLCDKLEVYCSGVCLSTVGEPSGNCTLLQNNIGRAGSIAVDATNLYYTAMQSEILKMDLQTMAHQSLITGLSNPTVLYPTSGLLYFGNNPTSGEDVTIASDIRVLFVGRSDVTVITENIGMVFGIFLSGDTLLFGGGVGSFPKGPLYSVSNKGGRWDKFSAPEILHLEVLGDTAYFSMNTDTESGIYTSSLSSPNSYSQVATGDITGTPISNFFITLDSAYWFASKATNTARVYTKVALAGGGQKQELGSAGSGILLAHNDMYVFYADTTSTGSNIMMMPINGGAATILGSYEPNEIRFAVADTSHLYVSLGYARTGGILRFDF